MAGINVCVKSLDVEFYESPVALGLKDLTHGCHLP